MDEKPSSEDIPDGFTDIELDLEEEHITFVESLVEKAHAAGDTDATFSTVLCEIIREWLDELDLLSEVEVTPIEPT